ncbi:hypothetical protein B296_00026374 [Ensete ventricosum]|uniref:Uncharacterized protein n=1 Tax=Ensete ventricosum TaxID=4639 RepID=A0A426YQ62_ENSVE|nr:hypothetical protein B296_00026374 [Ensete ventricosum]
MEISDYGISYSGRGTMMMVSGRRRHRLVTQLGSGKQRRHWWLGCNSFEKGRGREMAYRWLLREGVDGVDGRRAYVGDGRSNDDGSRRLRGTDLSCG